MPPLRYVLDELAVDVLPAAGVAALVVCLFALLGRWAGSLGSAAAIVVAFLLANFTTENLRGKDQPTWENTGRLVPFKSAENRAGWEWMPRAALVLVVVGLLSRWAGQGAARYLPRKSWWGANLLVWAPRIAAVFVVSQWLAFGRAATEFPMLRWHLITTILAVWVALDSLPRSERNVEVVWYLAAIFMAAAAILLYARTGKFMSVAVVLGSAMFGVALAATALKTDATGAIPAAALFLPGLLFGTRPSLVAEHKVPLTCFWLVALSPLVLLPFLTPALSRKQDWYMVVFRVLLVAAPLAVAVYIASERETLVFEKENEWE